MTPSRLEVGALVGLTVAMLLYCAALVSVADATPVVVTITPPTKRPGRQLAFVVDCSGSMEGLALARAIEAFELYAGAPIDEGELRVYAFDSAYAALPWTPLPNADHVRHACEWIAAQEKDGSTEVLPALSAALREPKPELTVVLVTDGWVSEPEDLIVETTKRAQSARKQPAVIGVVGIHDPERPNEKLQAIANLGGGGYYAIADAGDDDE